MDNEVKEFVEIISHELNDEGVTTSPNEKKAADELSNVANLSLPEPGLVNYWRDINNRVLWIDSEITEDIIGIVRHIIRWNWEDRDIPVEKRVPIKIYINSPGGLLIPSMAVCDAILASKTPVYGINMHEASSAAAFIFICCHHRMAMPNSFFLLHLGSGGTCGTFQQSRAQQENYNHEMLTLTSVLKTRLGITNEEEFDQLIDGEWYLYMDTVDGSKSDARRFNLITDEDPTLFWK